MLDGVTATRVVSVENIGTSATTGPITVSTELPVGVQWDSGVANGSGWSNCSQVVRTLTCSRSDQLGSRPEPAGPEHRSPGQQAERSVGPDQPTRSRPPVTRTRPMTLPAAPRKSATTRTPRSPRRRPVRSRSSRARSSSTARTATSPSNASSTSGAFAACTSPYSVTGLSIGVHSVQVRAVNEFGMADATPASASWEIIPVPKTGPSIPITAEFDRWHAVARLARFGRSAREPGQPGRSPLHRQRRHHHPGCRRRVRPGRPDHSGRARPGHQRRRRDFDHGHRRG